MYTFFFPGGVVSKPQIQELMAGLDDQDHQEVCNFVRTEMRETVVDEVVRW